MVFLKRQVPRTDAHFLDFLARRQVAIWFIFALVWNVAHGECNSNSTCGMLSMTLLLLNIPDWSMLLWRLMLILSADLEWITRMMVKLAENLHVYVLTTSAVRTRLCISLAATCYASKHMIAQCCVYLQSHYATSCPRLWEIESLADQSWQIKLIHKVSSFWQRCRSQKLWSFSCLHRWSCSHECM